MEQALIARSPRCFSEADLQDFIAMVQAGNEVDGKVLERNVRNAECLVFLRRNSCLTGVAALKNPLSLHRRTIKSESGISVEPMEFPFELGYVFVLPSARGQGLSVDLTKAALSASGEKGVFATARADNTRMHATLGKFGFKKVGSQYASDRGDYQLHLFVRPTPKPALQVERRWHISAELA